MDQHLGRLKAKRSLRAADRNSRTQKLAGEVTIAHAGRSVDDAGHLCATILQDE